MMLESFVALSVGSDVDFVASRKSADVYDRYNILHNQFCTSMTVMDLAITKPQYRTLGTTESCSIAGVIP